MISTLDSMACNMECHVNLIDRLSSPSDWLIHHISHPSEEQTSAEWNISCFICVQIHSFTACNPHSVRKALMLSMVLLTYLLRSKSSIQASQFTTTSQKPVYLHPISGDHCREVVAINWSLRVSQKIIPSSLKIFTCLLLLVRNFYISHPYSHACHYFHAHQPTSCSYSLPQWQSSMAPHFDPQTLQLSAHIYWIMSHWLNWQLTPGKHLAQSTHYLTKEDKDDWRTYQNLGLPFQTGTC